MSEKEKISHFSQLHAWQEAKKTAVLAYRLAKQFPDTEKYGLLSQVQRAAISIPANIAEGFGRHSYKEKIQFYHIGSLFELESHFLLAKELGLSKESDIQEVQKVVEVARRLLLGLIKASRGK